MRIKPVTDNPLFMPQAHRVNEKGGDSPSSGGQEKSQHDQNSKKDRNKEFEVTVAEVEQAIDSFSRDAQAAASGLTAQTEGNGPGLRVVLKDAQGTVIRQLTGEEFIKIRENISGAQPKPGKILDQKL